MISLYEGNDIYTLHLESGKTLELSESEINEIRNHRTNISDLEKEIQDLKESNDMMLSDIEEQGQYIRESEMLVLKLESLVENIKAVKLQKEIKETLRELKSSIDDLDFICRHI